MESTSLKPYQYGRLDPNVNEIRLCELLPGKFEDDLEIILTRATLEVLELKKDVGPDMTLDAIQQTVPKDWLALQTLEGRIIFHKARDYGLEEPFETTWQHPVTGVEPPRRDTLDDISNVEPKYEALSYVWGDRADASLAFVRPSSHSHETESRTLKITQALAQALRNLRYEDTSRTLWIDAICINQEDLEERSSQVRKMGYIYSHAQRVVMWLGPEKDDSTLAMTTLSFLGQQGEIVQNGGSWTTTPGCSHPAWSRDVIPLPYTNDTYDAIASLLDRPYFERLWIWQEVKLANALSVVQCGRECLALSVFRKAITCLRGKRAFLVDRGSILRSVDIASALAAPHAPGPFIFMLQRMRRRQCSMPQDRIYGALGLAAQSLVDELVPKYTVSAAEVYREACLVTTRNTCRLEVLAFCDLGRRVISGPTWVPDWSDLGKAPHLQTLSPAFQASGISRASLRIEDKTGVISCEGVLCGVIDSVCAGQGAASSQEELMVTLRKWMPQDCFARTYVTGEPLCHAFAKAICVGRLRERSRDTANYATMKEVESFLRDVSSGNATSLGSLASVWIHGRSLFTTKNGFLGVVHDTDGVVKPNDHICVLLGCHLPIILRPQESGQFSVVAPCYVPGLMDAEGLLGPFPPDWEPLVLPDTPTTKKFVYHHRPSSTTTMEDPRLGDVPPEWERFETVRTSEDPIHFVRFRHLETGEIINSDPRLFPGALKARGVDLRTFVLV